MDDLELTPWTKSTTTTAESELKTQRLAGGDRIGTGSTLGAEEMAKDMGNATTADTSSGDLNGEENHEYITGFKLFVVLASVTLAAFLMLLDGSIIGVVSWHA
jgi:hypothetical protein